MGRLGGWDGTARHGGRLGVFFQSLMSTIGNLKNLEYLRVNQLSIAWQYDLKFCKEHAFVPEDEAIELLS